MRFLGNIIWFLLGGWALFIGYALAAVIFFPLFAPLFRIARFSAWPFGSAAISKAKLEKYREIQGKSIDKGTLEVSFDNVGTLLNVLWFPVGLILALTHFFASIANLVLFFLIVTIPNIAGHWRLMPVALFPFNKVIVPAEIANEIEMAIRKNKLKI